jgi:hypothetical protein
MKQMRQPGCRSLRKDKPVDIAIGDEAKRLSLPVSQFNEKFLASIVIISRFFAPITGISNVRVLCAVPDPRRNRCSKD